MEAVWTQARIPDPDQPGVLAPYCSCQQDFPGGPSTVGNSLGNWRMLRVKLSGGMLMFQAQTWPPLTWRWQPVRRATLRETSLDLCPRAQCCFRVPLATNPSHSWKLVVLGFKFILGHLACSPYTGP